MYCIIMRADNSKIDKNLIPSVKGTTPYTFLGLLNRSFNKDRWWTCNPDELLVFKSKDEADLTCSKLKYGNPRVVTHGEAIRRITHWFWKSNRSNGVNMMDLLIKHESVWHDDDWDEGTNA